VSISGAFIETPLRARPSACITVETPERDGLPLKLLACVVRAGEGVIAVEWLEFAPLAIVGLLTDGRYASVAGESEHGPSPSAARGVRPGNSECLAGGDIALSGWLAVIARTWRSFANPPAAF
jgi:hypothetical protein